MFTWVTAVYSSSIVMADEGRPRSKWMVITFAISLLDGIRHSFSPVLFTEPWNLLLGFTSHLIWTNQEVQIL